MKIRIALVLSFFFVASCDSQGGREYLANLRSLIRDSDQIIITEHASEFDALDQKSGASLITEEVVYRTRELDAKQKSMFVTTVENLDPTTQDAFPACIPEVHHTVRFYSNGKLLSKMGICFECGQVIWNGTNATPPWALYSGLASVIRGTGLEPERDWSALANEYLQNRKQPATQSLRHH